jgi:hypothetical protein
LKENRKRKNEKEEEIRKWERAEGKPFGLVPKASPDPLTYSS